jgi:hypothetical protein
VVLDDASTNVLWPLPGGRRRWSFQLNPAEAAEEFRFKDRSGDDAETDRIIAGCFQRFIAQRAPWFTAEPREFDWVSRVQFERRLATQFGNGRCWLVGDAAHQTGPVGMQSLNVGLREAEALVADLTGLVRKDTFEATAGRRNYYAATQYLLPKQPVLPTEGFLEWNQGCREQWRRLLGLSATLKAAAGTDTWVRSRAERIKSCLPVSGKELNFCLNQLGLAGQADK